MQPSVTILMAIYKPRIEWLIEQAKSLNNQTYPNLKLLIWNDCPDDSNDYDEIFTNYINRIPYVLYKGRANMGSNKAFEKLTELADTEYVAYCDQDDVWLPNKIETLVKYAIREQAELLCSDMHIIDGYGVLVANSITEVRPHHVFVFSKEKFQPLCSRNFIVGCTTLVKTTLAKSSIPFPDEFVHDWWLGLNAAVRDTICIVKEPLIEYRIHGYNQTGVMTGVFDKQSYYEMRIKPVVSRSKVLLQRFGNSGYFAHLRLFNKYALIRQVYFFKHSPSFFCKFLRYLRINPNTVLFELILPIIPEFIFGYIIQKIRKGNL